jgi:FKBP-type peptidyl-prolyl cis-trans isomerases 1
MKVKIIVITLVLAATASAAFGQKKKDKTAAPAQETTTVNLGSQLDSVSYALGILFGSNLAQNGITEIKTDLMSLGLNDAISQKKTSIDVTKANELLNKFALGLYKKKSEKNLKDGEAFLAKNKTEPGVVVLASGLQYKILKDGNGPKPTVTSKVTVHYHGTLIDGRVFESSVENGHPASLSVDRVIEGWKEALPLMSVGSKWRLFIPTSLAYGENVKPGGMIGPNMALIFDVELISIDPEDGKPVPEANPEIQK